MPPHLIHTATSYLLATAVLSIYGAEVCPFLDELGIPAIAAIFLGTFAVTLTLRVPMYRGEPATASQTLARELVLWTCAALLLTGFDALVLDFPVASGLKVMVGTLTFALPAAAHQALLVERDFIEEVRASGERRTPPPGRTLSLSTRFFAFVATSQVLLASVLGLIIIRDFQHVVAQLAIGAPADLDLIAVEIGGTFLVMISGLALVARRYALNLDLILGGQLNALAEIAQGRLDATVPLISNDELGQIADRTNDMIVGLREKERIKGVFGKLVSPQVAKAVLAKEGGSELGGRTVEGVVLFTDIRNFTSLSEQSTPQGVVSFLNDYFTMVVDAVHEQGGILDKFIGDAAMAVFGLDGEVDAAERALHSALAIRAGLTSVNERLAERGLPQVDNGVGLHLGPMVAGNIGSAERLEYTVIGDAVNTASRLEGLCKSLDNPLLVSAALYEQLPDPLKEKLTALGDHTVKGKSGQIAIYGIAAG